MSVSTEKFLGSEKTFSACRVRADSPPCSTYAGKSCLLNVPVPAADQGASLELYNQPPFGLSRCGVSLMGRLPCQSVAGSLPSTGFVKSNRESRRGMKLP